MEYSKKVVFITSSLSSGGAERVISELSNYFSQHKIDVYILLISQNQIEYDLCDNIKIIPLCNEIKYKSGILAIINRIYKIRKYVNNISPDVVFSFLSDINIYSCIALGISKHKLIVSERNDPKNDPRSPVKRMLRYLTYNLADGYVFQTQQAKEYFPKRIQKKSKVIPNPLKKNLPMPYKGIRKKTIVAVGRLENQKNYPLLFEAFDDFSKEFPDYNLVVYGDGSKRAQLEELIINMGLKDKIILKGIVQNFHEDIKDAAMYVMTSNFEGMPNALMEAMAIGLPCISSNCPCGGPALLINHMENGLLFDVGDKEELVKYMKLIVKNNDLARSISERAYHDLQNYVIDRIANQWLEFVDSLT